MDFAFTAFILGNLEVSWISNPPVSDTFGVENWKSGGDKKASDFLALDNLVK